MGNAGSLRDALSAACINLLRLGDDVSALIRAVVIHAVEPVSRHFVNEWLYARESSIWSVRIQSLRSSERRNSGTRSRLNLVHLYSQRSCSDNPPRPPFPVRTYSPLSVFTSNINASLMAFTSSARSSLPNFCANLWKISASGALCLNSNPIRRL